MPGGRAPSPWPSADLEGANLPRVGVGARGFHDAAGVLESRAVPVVVPDVPAVTPIAVGLGAGAPAGVDLHIPAGHYPVGPECVDVPGPVSQGPVGQGDRTSGAVVQLDPLGGQARGNPQHRGNPENYGPQCGGGFSHNSPLVVPACSRHDERAICLGPWPSLLLHPIPGDAGASGPNVPSKTAAAWPTRPAPSAVTFRARSHPLSCMAKSAPVRELRRVVTRNLPEPGRSSPSNTQDGRSAAVLVNGQPPADRPAPIRCMLIPARHDAKPQIRPRS